MLNHTNVLFTNEVIVTTAIIWNLSMQDAELFLMGIEDEVSYEYNKEMREYLESRAREIALLEAEQHADDIEDIIDTNKVKVKTTIWDKDVLAFIEKTEHEGLTQHEMAKDWWTSEGLTNQMVSSDW